MPVTSAPAGAARSATAPVPQARSSQRSPPLGAMRSTTTSCRSLIVSVTFWYGPEPHITPCFCLSSSNAIGPSLGRRFAREHTSVVSDLFADAAQERLQQVAPLALRLRPRSLEEFVGQEQVLGEHSALRLAITEDRVGSAILYGPPGTGKTTLARIVAETTGAAFEELSAVSATVSDVRGGLARARDRLGRVRPGAGPPPGRNPPLHKARPGG